MKGKLLKKYFIKKATFIKKCTTVALAACLAFPVSWGVLREPVRVMAEQFVPIENLEIGLTEAVVGQRYVLNRDTIKTVIPSTATNQSGVKWMIFYPYGMNIEIEGNKANNVTAFTPNEEGYIWLYVEVELGAKSHHSNQWVTDGNFKKFFKVAVKNAAGGAEPDIYPASAKDKLKPIKTPISMGWFRTWHDYWVEAAWAESSNKFGDAPEEVDIMAIFPDYTSPDNPFWEVLKNEYVPKLNERGTRVVRTIGMQDVTGTRGLSKTFTYEKDEEGYRKLAEEIVKEYVDKFNLDGLDIDFERENNPHDEAGIKQGIAVIKEISKIIGKKSDRPNTIFMVDTDMALGEANEIFPEILPHVDFLARQNYRHENESSYASFKDYIRKDQFISGFSFYEENGNQWRNVPSADLVADRNTNETTLQNPDELLQKPEFTTCDAYNQAKWVSEGGYGGIAAYAIDRDGVAHGNNKKFFKLSDGGQPTKYYVSRALKHFMRYNASKDVTDIKDVPTKFNAGDTLILTGTVKPDDAAKTDITWEIVQGADKTTAKEAKIEEENKLTATGEGKITVKATVKEGVKTGNVLEYQDFSKEFEITVNKKPVINSSGGGSQYVPVVDFIKEKLEKEKLEKEKLEKEKLEKEKLEKEKLEKEKLEKEKEALLKKNAPVEEIIKTKNKTASVGEDVIQKVLKANNGKVKVKVKSTIVSINRDIIENLVGEEKKDIKVSVTKSGKNKLNLMKFKKKLSDKKLVSNTVLAVDIKMGSESVNDYDLNGGKVEIIVETSLKKLPKVVYVMNLNTGKIIKAKYSKKTKKIYFSTEKVGKFVLIKK